MASAMAFKLNYLEHYTKRRRKREKKERKGVGNGDCDPVITESPEPSDTSWRLASSRKWMWAHLQAPPRPPFLRSWYRSAKENTNEKWLESTKYLESSLEPILALALGLGSCTGVWLMVLSDWATGGDDAEISPFELLFYSESSNTRIELNSILLKQPIEKIACTSSSQLEIEARNIVWESSPSVSSSNSAIWQDYLWFSELAEALVPDCSKPYPTAFRHHQYAR